MFNLALLSLAPLLASLATAQAQHGSNNTPQPGQTVPMLFLNTTTNDLTATVQHRTPGGATTYLVNCAADADASCTIHDSTISVVSVPGGGTYDFSTGTNMGGSLTIHCAIAADGRTPKSCTRTVAGGSEGYQIATGKPKPGQWRYVNVKITKLPVRGGGGGAMDVYAGFGGSAGSSSSQGAGGSDDGSGGTAPINGDTGEEGAGNMLSIPKIFTAGAALVVGLALFF